MKLELPDWHDATEAEDRAIARAGVKAAWQELQLLNDECADMAEKVRAGVAAVKSATEAVEKAKKALEKDVGKPVASDVDIFYLVASVADALDRAEFIGDDDMHPYSVDDIPLYSIGGGKILVLMRTAIAMRGLYMLQEALTDYNTDVVLGAFLEAEIKALAEGLNTVRCN